MIVVVLKDGLGNQLFQYAAARCLAYKLGTELKIDIQYFKEDTARRYSLNHFNIQEQFLSPNERFLLRSRHRISRVLNKLGIHMRRYRYHQQGLEFNPEFFALPDNMFVEGYWQTEKNFIDIEKIIREEFVVKEGPQEKNKLYLDQMKDENAIAVHVRRGDYVKDANINSIHGVCDLSYYIEAIDYMAKRVSDPRLFIFSDDMDWVRQNLDVNNLPVCYVDHNEDKDYEDMRLMYSCKHNIIANSSFSWWGAWLNNNKNKIVIAPAKWYNSKYSNRDITPESWIRL